MNKKSSYVPLKALLFAVFAALALPAGAVESKDPIKLTLHDWTGQYLTTTLMGEVLKKAGYNIEYVQADYIAQFAGLESGDLHIAMEMWETTGKQVPARPSISAKPEWMPRKSGGIRCT
jgi:glycine betaine/proline transport system substrate-binding protein